MKKELGTIALCGIILIVMYTVGEGIIELVKGLASAFGLH